MDRSSPDYIVDIAGVCPPAGAGASGDGVSMRGRPWLSVKWRCCSVYSRVYRNRRGDTYEGRCPKCGTPVKATVGEGGTSSRFFEAG